MESLRMEQTSLMVQKTGGCSTTFCCWKDSPAPAYSYFIFDTYSIDRLQIGFTPTLNHIQNMAAITDSHLVTKSLCIRQLFLLSKLTGVTMIVTLLIGFQVIAIIFLGSFARTDTASSGIISYHPLFTSSALICLAFTLIYAPYRKLSLYSIASILLVIGATAQTYLLFGTFWDSCFNGFEKTFNVDLSLIIRSLFASLTVLLTVLDFLGLFCYWQVYLIIAPVLSIGSSLCGSIIIRGLKVFDGGGGLLVFFYSGVCSLMIWAMILRGKLPTSAVVMKKSFLNHAFGLIGLILLFINWPKFNSAGAFLSYVNVNTTTISISYLQNSALVNTFLALSVSILIATFFSQKDSETNKIQYTAFVQCVINGGISVASFQDVSLDPITSLLIAGCSSFLTLVFKRKIKESPIDNELVSQYPGILYRILFPFIGIVVCSMVVGGRASRSPSLLSDNYSKTAGLQIVAMIVVLAFALIFGAIAAVLIKVFLMSKGGQPSQDTPAAQKSSPVAKQQQTPLLSALQLTDSIYFSNLEEEACPLYYDMFSNLKEMDKESYQFIKQSGRIKKALAASDNPLKLMLLNKNVETGPPPNSQQTSTKQLIISKNFTRDNPQQKIQTSQMKYQYPEKDESLLLDDSICQPLPLESQHANRQKSNKQEDNGQIKGIEQDSSLKEQPQHQIAEFVEPQKQKSVTPYKKSFVSAQKQGFSSPQKKSYLSSRKQGYTSPQKQGYASSQKQQYVQPEQKGYISPEKQQNVVNESENLGEQPVQSHIERILPSDFDSKQQIEKDDSLGMISIGDNLLVSRATRQRQLAFRESSNDRQVNSSVRNSRSQSNRK